MKNRGCRSAGFLAVAILSAPVYAEVYELPPDGNDVIGAVSSVRARAEETLLDIARRHGLGYEDIVRANPLVDPERARRRRDVALARMRRAGYVTHEAAALAGAETTLGGGAASANLSVPTFCFFWACSCVPSCSTFADSFAAGAAGVAGSAARTGSMSTS